MLKGNSVELFDFAIDKHMGLCEGKMKKENENFLTIFHFSIKSAELRTLETQSFPQISMIEAHYSMVATAERHGLEKNNVLTFFYFGQDWSCIPLFQLVLLQHYLISHERRWKTGRFDT